MSKMIIPKGYEPNLNLHDTQVGIKTVKDFFQNLYRPLWSSIFKRKEKPFTTASTLVVGNFRI